MIGAEEAWSSTMVKFISGWIVLNWTSRLLPINFTSLLEEDLSITRPGTCEFESCSPRGHKIVSLFSQFHYAKLVDLVCVSMLSFESLKTVHYSLSFDDLNFDVEFLICSIPSILDNPCLTNDWFMTYDVCTSCWYDCFQKLEKMFMLFLLVHCSSRFAEEDDPVLATVFDFHCHAFPLP